jgi:hypothetical protein
MKNTRLIILLLIIPGFLLFEGCGKSLTGIKGEGPVVSQDFDLPLFWGIAQSIDANVILSEGDVQSVRVEGQQNIINNLKQTVSNGVWNLDYHDNVRTHAGLTIYITSPNIDYLTVSGSGNIESTNTFTDTTNVYLNISGSGNISLRTNAWQVQSIISGSGNINISGWAINHSATISGSGSVRAFDLITENTNVTISGSGIAQVYASDYLNVTISGSGSVFYRGNPQINVNITGSGALINSN